MERQNTQGGKKVPAITHHHHHCVGQMGIRKRGGGCFEGDCGWGCVPIVALLGDEDDLGRLAWLASAWVEALGVARVAAAVCVEDEGNNKAVKTKHLSEDKNQDHTNKQLCNWGGGGER